MQNLKLLFKLASYISLVGWILLICFPHASYTDTIVSYIVVVLLCFIYIYLLAIQKNIPGEKYPRGSFRTFEGIVRLFQNPRVVLVGWVHFLAFDLMIGLYIKNDALLNNIHFLMVIPCLLLTLMFGPIGLLCYYLLKSLFNYI